jgi:hypothetical protein
MLRVRWGQGKRYPGRGEGYDVEPGTRNATGILSHNTFTNDVQAFQSSKRASRLPERSAVPQRNNNTVAYRGCLEWLLIAKDRVAGTMLQDHESGELLSTTPFMAESPGPV